MYDVASAENFSCLGYTLWAHLAQGGEYSGPRRMEPQRIMKINKAQLTRQELHEFMGNVIAPFQLPWFHN
jgi:hypothetical protein